MLLIDLLPEDRRPVERTPLPRLLTVIAGVLISGVELAYIALLLMVRIPGAQGELDSEKGRIRDLKDCRKKIAELKANQSEFERRKKTIIVLYKQRMRWAPKLDAISNPTVLPERVWLGTLDVEEKKGGRGRAEKYLFIQGWARGESSRARNEAINQFVMRLESNPQFYSDFVGSLSEDLKIEYEPKRPPKGAADNFPRKTNRFEMRARFKPRAPVGAKPKKKAGR